MWMELEYVESRDSAVGIANGYGLDDQGAEVWVPVGQEFLLLHVVQIDTGAHPASYPLGTGGFFRESKAAGAWSCPFTPN
jgi:hypothetical protein